MSKWASMALKSRSACIQPRGPSNCILRRALLGIGGGRYLLCAFVPESAGAQGLLDSLFKKRTEADLLPPEKAFEVRANASGPDSVMAVFELAPGYYLYRDRIQFRLVDSPEVALRPVTLPKGVPKKAPTFGLTDVYREPMRVRLQFDGKVRKPARAFTHHHIDDLMVSRMRVLCRRGWARRSVFGWVR